jgi:hypothetical protein
MKKEQSHSATAHEPFVSLVQMIHEDSQVQAQIVPLLKLDPFNRKSAINTWLEQLQYQRAPADFRRALACLLDDAIALKILEIIGE